MAAHIDAGRMDKPAQVLDLRETSPGVWEWVVLRRVWANITLSRKTNLFSKVGVGARDAQIIVRRQALTPHQALRGGERHLLLTAVTERGRNHLDVSAAVVNVETVKQLDEEGKGTMTFPGVRTEKYVKHEQEWPMSVNDAVQVLVVSKPIRLRPGCLVEIGGELWEVLTPHELDQYKNEYEIGRRVDL